MNSRRLQFPRKRKVLLVESSPGSLEPYHLILESSDAFEVMGKVLYSDVTVIRKSAADVFIVYVPDEADADLLIHRMKDSIPYAELIVICESVHPSTVIALLKAGADGMISSRTSLLDFVEAMMKTLHHGVAISRDIANIVVKSYHTVSGREILGGREIQVIELLSRGYTCSKVATELRISPETVKTHVKNIYKKLGVSKKSEAIARAKAARIIAQRGN